MSQIHSRLAAIMFVQVTESTETVTELPVASCQLKESEKDFCKYLDSFDGKILEISSGEFYVSFGGAVSAFNAALGLQALLPQYNLRIGLHLGEVLQQQDKFLGRDVNLAARLPKLARAGGVCLSQSVYQYLEDEEKQILVPIGVHALKNIDAGVPLFAYLPAGQANRCKRREIKRKLREKIKKHKWFAWLAYLAMVVGVYSLPHFVASPVAERIILKLYVTEFEFHPQHGEKKKLVKSIEIAVRSLLSGRYEGVDIHLQKERTSAQLELLVSIEHQGNSLLTGYIIKGLPQGKTLAYGGFEVDDSKIFQLQDRLAEQVLTALPE